MSVINKILGVFGHELIPITLDLSRWNTEYLKMLKTNPATVLDIGVGHGTHELYKTFPDAYHVLVEPLEEFQTDIRKILKKYKGKHCPLAVGRENGKRTFNVNLTLLECSSFCDRIFPGGSGDSFQQREVEVVTLDDLVEKERLSAPFVLKIDAEGYELEIIEGATKLLNNTDFVIAELSLIKRFNDSCTLGDFIRSMEQRGFRVFTVLYMNNRIIDAVFKRVPV